MDFTKILTGNPDGVPSRLGNPGPFSITGPYTACMYRCGHHLLSHDRTSNRQQTPNNNQPSASNIPSIAHQQSCTVHQFNQDSTTGVAPASNQQGRGVERTAMEHENLLLLHLMSRIACGLQKASVAPATLSSMFNH